MAWSMPSRVRTSPIMITSGAWRVSGDGRNPIPVGQHARHAEVVAWHRRRLHERLAGSTPAVADGRRGAVQRRHRDRDDVQQAAAQGRLAIDAHGREADVREGRPRHAGADRTPLPRSARGGMILEAPTFDATLYVAERMREWDRREIFAARWNDDPFPLAAERSEEHTSELPSLMRISYAVFCLKKKP